MFKQAIISLLVFTASFCLYAQDTTAPVLHNIYVSPSIINAGDSITVTIEITDDISGIDGIGFPNNQNGSTFAFVSSLNQEFFQSASVWSYVSGNTYKSTILIPFNVFSGLWKVNTLFVKDIAGNEKVYLDSINFSVFFTVNSSYVISDTTAPQLVSISTNKDTFFVPEIIFFNMEIIETESGFDPTYSQLFMSSTNCSKLWMSGNWSEDSLGNWSSNTFFDIWKVGGNWVIDSIILYDIASNKRSFFNGVDYNSNIFIVEELPDCSKPEFFSVYITPNVLYRGDTLSVYLEMKDTISGLRLSSGMGGSPTEVSISNQYGQQDYSVDLFEPTQNMNIYLGKKRISEYASNGVWSINKIFLADLASNYLYTYNYPYTTYEVIPDSLRIIEGTILTSDSLPLKNSKVFMIKQNPIDSNIYVMRLAFTDTIGYYRFESEKRDSLIFLKAIPNLNLYPNQIPTYLDSTILFSNARMVQVSNILSTIDTFHTLQGTNEGGFGFISGFLSDGAGKRSSGPLANMDLILATITGEPINGAKTNSDGYFSFQNIPNGTYIIYPAVRNPDFSQAPVFYINDTSRYTLLDFAFLNNYIALSTTSVEAIELNYLKIYPNPVNEKLIVEYRSIKPSDFELYDIVGKEIDINIESQINKVLIDFSKVKSGTYLLKTSMKSGDSKVSRILVE